jgi:peptidoglycan/xylan/chitin deacetylase (PgdA/CDA1 family)
MLRVPFIACLLAVFLAVAGVTESIAATKKAAAKSTPAPAPAAQPAATPAPAPTPQPAETPAPDTGAAPKITYSSCHVDGPYIAMTFDDGPHPQNTPRLLDMLKQRNIKATFFLVGECVAANPQIVKRIVAEGHEIGNHSWNHPQLSKMTDASVRDQLQKTQDAIVSACGIVPKLMRPPYGAFTQRQQRWANGEFGYKIILWDVDPEDWKIRDSNHVQAEILKQTVSGSIILSHDIHKTTVDAMPATLDALAAKGFKFVTVPELIAMDKPRPPKAAKGATAAATGPDQAPAKAAPAPATAAPANAAATPPAAPAAAPAPTAATK